MNWPPVYTVKTHPRARHVKLKSSVKRGLEIIVPPRFNHNHIPGILEQNKNWIIKHFFKLQQTLDKRTQDELPNEIYLTAMNQRHAVHYIPSHNKKLQLMIRPDQALVLLGDIQNKLSIKKLLSQWTKKQAASFLTRLLYKISETTDLPFKEVSYRCQATRWGSCSAQKNISLNYKLIFLPPELVSHVMIHELCHTIHLNHSGSFWKKVASLDPNWREHVRAVKQGDSFVPEWFE